MSISIGGIPRRSGIAVEISGDLTIDLTQKQEYPLEDDMIVNVHPNDVDQLIELLMRARDEIRRINEIGEAASADADADPDPDGPAPLRAV